MKNDYKKFWVTNSGEKIAYVAMSDAHIINTYRMVMRNLSLWGLFAQKESPNTAEALHALETEINKRGIQFLLS